MCSRNCPNGWNNYTSNIAVNLDFTVVRAIKNDILKGIEEHSADAIAELIRKDGQFMRRFEIFVQREV